MESAGGGARKSVSVEFDSCGNYYTLCTNREYTFPRMGLSSPRLLNRINGKVATDIGTLFASVLPETKVNKWK